MIIITNKTKIFFFQISGFRIKTFSGSGFRFFGFDRFGFRVWVRESEPGTRFSGFIF